MATQDPLISALVAHMAAECDPATCAHCASTTMVDTVKMLTLDGDVIETFKTEIEINSEGSEPSDGRQAQLWT